MQAAGALRADWGTGGRASATSSVTFVICSVLEGREGMTAAAESLLIWRAGLDDETERERLMLFLPCLTVSLSVLRGPFLPSCILTGALECERGKR